MIGVGLTVDRDRVMVGENNTKFGEKRRFGNLAVGNKKGKEAEGRERRGGGGGRNLEGRGRGSGNEGLAMDVNFYQREIL